MIKFISTLTLIFSLSVLTLTLEFVSYGEGRHADATTGMTPTLAYSNNGGATWTYTPSSAAGGAPTGYDRNVTHVRWSFGSSLSQTSPNNAGSVGLTTRIR